MGGHRGNRLGHNRPHHQPGKGRINEYVLSIAMYGILVPLIADKTKDGYLLQVGYTRMAAIAWLKADKALSALANMNEMHLDPVPLREESAGTGKSTRAYRPFKDTSADARAKVGGFSP